MGESIKKLQVKEVVLFAMNHLPQADNATLERFLELVNATGTFGAITYEQLVNKMRLTLKYVPNACPGTMTILADLLEMSVKFESNEPPQLTIQVEDTRPQLQKPKTPKSLPNNKQ